MNTINLNTAFDRDSLLKKSNSRSEIWNYFRFLPDETGKPIDDGKPICRECLQRIQAKGGNTSNLIKHLRMHPTSFTEYTKVCGTYLTFIFEDVLFNITVRCSTLFALSERGTEKIKKISSLNTAF